MRNFLSNKKQMATEFVLNLRRQLVEEKKVAESTADAYVKTLTILNGKKPFKNLNFLKKTDEVLALVREYADSTQRAILATIVSTLSLFPKLKKTYEVYRTAMSGKVEEHKEEVKETEGHKTEKQEENWMTLDEINAKKAELADAVASLPKKNPLVKEYDALLNHLVLSLYTDIEPRRNQDYLKMMVVKKYSDDLSSDSNYYDIKGKRFVFNKFKTAKTYGRQMVELPEPLVATLTRYLKYHPLAKEMKTGFPLLVSHDGQPLTAVNAITRILNRIFGKKVGSSMLRRIFVTEKFGGAKTEMEATAKAMAHSVDEQQKVYNTPRPPKVTLPTIDMTASAC